jgi:catechol 2,3-dioxygenase-like lactoylglutathione lyase family enzyme
MLAAPSREDAMDQRVEVQAKAAEPDAGRKPLLRGIHHLALNTSDMRGTLDFYVRVLGMRLAHGMRTPARLPDGRSAHGGGTPPYPEIPHFFLDMGGDSLLAFFEYPKGIAKADRDALGAMQHVSFVCGPKRHAEMLERLKANGVAIIAGPLLIIPPAIHSFYFFDPNGIRLEIVTDRNGPDEGFALVRSCVMSEADMRAQLRAIGGDEPWIDGMIAAQAR